MSSLDVRPNALQRWLQRIPASRLGAQILSRFGHSLDAFVHRISGGRWPSLAPFLFGFPTAALECVGARSGKTYLIPLVVIPDGSRVLLVASNWGRPRHPSWYYNLKKNPEVKLHFGGAARPYTARELHDEDEYSQKWEVAASLYAGYNAYRRRSGRRIPLFELTP